MQEERKERRRGETCQVESRGQPPQSNTRRRNELNHGYRERHTRTRDKHVHPTRIGMGLWASEARQHCVRERGGRRSRTTCTTQTPMPHKHSWANTHPGCAATTASINSEGLDVEGTSRALSPAPVTSLASANINRRTRTGARPAMLPPTQKKYSRLLECIYL